MILLLGCLLVVVGIILPIFTIRAAVTDYYSLNSMVNIVINAFKDRKLPDRIVPNAAIIWVIVAVAFFIAAGICFLYGSNVRIKNKRIAKKVSTARTLLFISCIFFGISYPVMVLMKILCNVDILFYTDKYDLLYMIGTGTMIVSIISGILMIIGFVNIVRNI